MTFNRIKEILTETYTCKDTRKLPERNFQRNRSEDPRFGDNDGRQSNMLRYHNTLSQGNAMMPLRHIAMVVAYLFLVYKRMLSGKLRNRQPKADTKYSSQSAKEKGETSVRGLEHGQMPVTSVGCANDR
jgi:hypothetical protein